MLPGGQSRAESVRNAVDKLNGEMDLVLVHDVARPFVSPESVLKLIKTARRKDAVLLAEKATATVKETGSAAKTVKRTLDRNRIFLAQTPQVFKTSLLKKAYRKLGTRIKRFTDEAGMMESINQKVWIVEGPSSNIKITTPADLKLAESIYRKDLNLAESTRIGMGSDIHPLVPGRKLMLGGLRIPFDKGLAGHSDGDVVIHAVIDAMLGAMGEQDIGEWFSDSSKENRGISSRVYLERIVQRAKERRFSIVNLDIIIFAEEPKLGPYKEKIRRSLATALGLNVDQLNVKAKTQEGFGAVGEKKALSCQCIALIKTITTLRKK